MNDHPRPGIPELSALRIRRDARPAPRRRKLGWLLIPIILLLIGGGAATVYLHREKLLGLAPLVETGEVVRRGGSASSVVQTANGYVVARRQAGITPKVSGRIKRLYKDLGDSVKAGEVIAELEDSDIQAMLEEARATQWVNEVTAERDRKLLAQDIGTQAEYDISLARAKEAAARVKNLMEQIENTRVRAPFDGILIVKNGEEGETISLFGGQTSRRSGPIFVIADFREFEVEADVGESNISKIAPGQDAEVILDANPDRSYRGRLRQIVPTADRQKATVQVKVTILDPDQRVYPDMSARVNFLRGGAVIEPEVIEAPRAGIVERGGRQVAFVLAGDKVEERVVELETPAGWVCGVGRAAVKKGLSGGETIVLDPPAEISGGSRVRARPRESQGMLK